MFEKVVRLVNVFASEKGGGVIKTSLRRLVEFDLVIFVFCNSWSSSGTDISCSFVSAAISPTLSFSGLNIFKLSFMYSLGAHPTFDCKQSNSKPRSSVNVFSLSNWFRRMSQLTMVSAVLSSLTLHVSVSVSGFSMKK